MSIFPDSLPDGSEETPTRESVESPSTDPLSPENTPAPPPDWSDEPGEPDQPHAAVLTPAIIAAPIAAEERDPAPIFAAYMQPPPPSDERIPHLGHLGLLALLILFGWVGAGMLLFLGLHMHLWGITKIAQAATDFRYTLASQTAQYFITFAACLTVFPLVWHRPFFVGVHWNIAFALRRPGRLVSAAVFCFFVAIINGVLMPGPTNAPIDELFRAPGAAWILFAFGVTLAPFFEEMAFRGFLLPSLCTAYDWCAEHLTGTPRRPVDEYDNPQWSLPAMIVASVITSIPFALMHGAQTGWSLGPFLLLIFVSLVLCSVRLQMRSLAASTMVHSCYNFMLFSFMLLGTGGFRHLDKM